MVSITINDIEYKVKPDISILEACKYIGIHIPRFCYHEKLSVAGNCRMCLVEIDPFEKPFASCATDITENMEIYVDTPFVKKARESVLEMILLNHPLDCPICDQAGECDLQDQTKEFGSTFSKYYFNKKSAVDDYRGPLISTIMTRCISCTRCVRYGDEIAGVNFFGTVNRGNDMKISTYVSKIIESEISGNVIDLCPVGALTALPYKFVVRPWEVITLESIDTTDSIGSNIYVNWKENQIIRILPRPNVNLNHTFISDKARFVYDSSLENRLVNINATYYQNILSEIKNNISEASLITFFVDDSCDLDTMVLIKNLQNTFKKKIQIVSISGSNTQSNFYFNLNFQLDDFSNCNRVSTQLIGTNLRTEASILNYKLRSLYLLNNYKVTNLGSTSDSNIENLHTFFNNSNILKLFEGSYESLKQYQSVNTINVFGQSAVNLISNFLDFKNYINKLYLYNSVLHIFENSNTAGASLLNIGYSKFKQYGFCIFANLPETQKILKIAHEIKSLNKLSFNTHAYNDINQISNFVLGCTNDYEGKKLYLNLLDMPQTTETPNTLTNSVKSMYDSVSNIFEPINKNSYVSHLVSLAEEYPSYYLKKKYTFYLSIYFLAKYLVMSQVSKYVIKLRNKNYYLSNKQTRYSSTLLEASALQHQHFNTYILS